jgi:hypothetical protein
MHTTALSDKLHSDTQNWEVVSTPSLQPWEKFLICVLSVTKVLSSKIMSTLHGSTIWRIVCIEEACRRHLHL